MQALGLTCIRAPGEGEGLCAQLCAVGAATAVWTTDGDALLYGAPRVYRSLKLSRQNMRKSEAEHIDIRVVRSLFGLSSQCDCHETLVAFALLAGCDYAVDGVDGVGAAGVVRALRHLITSLPRNTSSITDAGLLDHIKQLLLPDNGDASKRVQHCTGCQHCGHDSGGSGRVPHSINHRKNGCVQCGLTLGCLPKAADASCSCPWHASAEERHVLKVLGKARNTTDFVKLYDGRVAAYSDQRASARAVAQQHVNNAARSDAQLLRWGSRPDIDRLFDIVKVINWNRDTVLRKTLPLLLLWDATHPGAAGRATGTCFKVSKVVKPSGEGAACGLPAGTAYMVQWAAFPDVAQTADVKLALELLSKQTKNDAAESKKEKPASEDVHVLWTRILRQHAAGLLAACEADCAAKQERKDQAARRKADRETKKALELRTQPKINTMLAATQRGMVAPSNGAVAKSRLHHMDDVRPPQQACSDGAPSGGYRTSFGLPRDDDDDEVNGTAGAGAPAEGAGYSSESEELPAGWNDRSTKRASPLKASQMGGTPPKKAKPQAHADAGGPSTARRTMDSFLLPRKQVEATPATAEQAPRDCPERARGGATRKLGFDAPGPVTDAEVINLCSPDEVVQPQAEEVVDLSDD